MKSFAGRFKHMPGKEKAAVPVVTKMGPGEALTLEVHAAAIILKYLVSIFFFLLNKLLPSYFFHKLSFQAVRRSPGFCFVLNLVFTQMIANALCKANILKPGQEFWSWVEGKKVLGVPTSAVNCGCFWKVDP